MPLIFYVLCYQFVKTFFTENQKIRIECVKANDVCIIQKTVEPKFIRFKSSMLSEVKSKYVSRGCYDVKFVFGNDSNYRRLYGAGSCTGNARNLNLIVNEFTNYIKNRDEYLLIKLGDEFYLPFLFYLLPFTLLFFLFAFIVFPRRQELYLDAKNQVLVVWKYNLLNICFRNRINLLDVKEFFDSSHKGMISISCKYKNGKKAVILTNFYEKDNPSLICEELNSILN